VGETAIGRLEREVETLTIRVRNVENLDTPMARQLTTTAQKLQDQVASMDVHGTQVTQVRLRNIEDDIGEIKDGIREMRSTQESSRRAVNLALLAGTLSLAGSLILFAVVKASGG
jgi:MFS superfamily sulfate permease-like transporter